MAIAWAGPGGAAVDVRVWGGWRGPVAHLWARFGEGQTPAASVYPGEITPWGVQGGRNAGQSIEKIVRNGPSPPRPVDCPPGLGRNAQLARLRGSHAPPLGARPCAGSTPPAADATAPTADGDPFIAWSEGDPIMSCRPGVVLRRHVEPFGVRGHAGSSPAPGASCAPGGALAGGAGARRRSGGRT